MSSPLALCEELFPRNGPALVQALRTKKTHLFGYHLRHMPKHSLHIMDLARLGAAARIKELQTEIASLREAFPDRAAGILIHQPSVKRRRVSAAARARMSAAQKARWPKQKATK